MKEIFDLCKNLNFWKIHHPSQKRGMRRLTVMGRIIIAFTIATTLSSCVCFQPCITRTKGQVTFGFLRSRTNRRPCLRKTALASTSDEHHASSDPKFAFRPTALSFSLQELTTIVQGKGRAQAIRDLYRQGIDPLLTGNNTTATDVASPKALELLRRHCVPVSAVTQLVQQTTAADGTTKLLLQLSSSPDETIETVLIPWGDTHSTLCVSSQVGCRQACRFCATGRMGLRRSLTCDEIVAQTYWATKVQQQQSSALPPIQNIVFMGMGEPADNAHAVVSAVDVLVELFAMAPRRITVSTVAPTVDSFSQLARAPAVLAWSVHASRDEVRRFLVPTTPASNMVQLRDEGLLPALRQRSRRLRSVMMEVTLLDGINDSVEDAEHLAEFCRPIDDNGVRLVVNLIPWNDIQATFGPAAQFRAPARERVLQFQRILRERGLQCFIRTTRGDDSSAACGQLATTVDRNEQAARAL